MFFFFSSIHFGVSVFLYFVVAEEEHVQSFCALVSQNWKSDFHLCSFLWVLLVLCRLSFFFFLIERETRIYVPLRVSICMRDTYVELFSTTLNLFA